MAVQVDQYGNPVTGGMWYGGSPAPSVASGSPLAPAGGTISGTPLLAGGGAMAAGYGPSPTATAAAAGPVAAGPLSGASAGSGMGIGAALPAALLGFMGGYNNQPGLALVGAKLYENSVTRAQQAKMAAVREATYAATDLNDRDSVINSADKLYKMGLTPEADQMMKRAETLWKRDNMTFKERYDVVKPHINKALESKAVLRNLNETIKQRSGGKTGEAAFDSLTEADAVGIATQVAKQESGGVLSDDEYRRVAGMDPGIQVVNALKDMLNLPAEAPPTTVLKALYQRAYANAADSQNQLESISGFVGGDTYTGRDLGENLLGTTTYKIPPPIRGTRKSRREAGAATPGGGFLLEEPPTRQLGTPKIWPWQ